MLMTKFIFLIHKGDKGYHTVVTRLADGKQKYFFQAGERVEKKLNEFMESMTDELVEGYFPKPDKKGRPDVDNWSYLAFDIDRHVAQARAAIRYDLDLLVKKVRKEMGW